MAKTRSEGTGGGTGQSAGSASGELGLYVAAALIGFFMVPMIANVAPVWVNGFLLLILIGSLLYQQDRWLPYLKRL